MLVTRLAFAAGLLMSGLACAEAPTARIIDVFTLSTGLTLNGVEFGGISGLAFDRESGLYLALSDDRSEKGPARFYPLDIQVDAKGFARLEIRPFVALLDGAGQPFAREAVDPEAMVALPDGTFVWTSEGTALMPPAIIQMDRNGRPLRPFALPDYYRPSEDRAMGVRNNLGHEGLALSADGRQLYAFLENALAQDGPIATPESGSPARVLVLDVASGLPTAEYVYMVEPVAMASTAEKPFHDNGVSEALRLKDGRLLVLERSYAAGYGNTIRLFLVAVNEATNVLGRQALGDLAAIKPLEKTLIATWRHGENGRPIDNLEAMVQGPDMDGKPSLIIASDNNFNRRGQVSQFLLVVLN